MSTLRITDDTTAEELAEAIGHLNHLAKRETPVVGTADLPTPWDKRHASLDAMLTDWERARG